jgi:radical SAM protein with 4Fe4S-binding SPASM domain
MLKHLKGNVWLWKRGDKCVIYNSHTLKKRFLRKNERISAEILNRMCESFTPRFPEIKKYRIEVTFLCNGACDYCLVQKNPIKKSKDVHMKLEVVKKIVKRFDNEVGKNGDIMIMGGEPLLNWKVVKFILEHSLAKKKTIFTNGVLINDEMADVFRETNTTVYVSLDGPYHLNSMRKLRDGEPMFHHSISGLFNLKRKKVKFGVRSVANPYNVDKIPDIVKFFVEDLDVFDLGISIPHYTNFHFFKERFELKKYVNGLLSVYNYILQKGVFLYQVSRKLKAFITETPRVYGCKIAGEQRTFYPNGKETICTKLDTMKKTWSHRKLFYKTPYFNEKCVKCPAVGICGGGCFWDGIKRFGEFVDRRECEINIPLLDKIIGTAWNLWDMGYEAPNEMEKKLSKVISG